MGESDGRPNGSTVYNAIVRCWMWSAAIGRAHSCFASALLEWSATNSDVRFPSETSALMQNTSLMAKDCLSAEKGSLFKSY